MPLVPKGETGLGQGISEARVRARELMLDALTEVQSVVKGARGGLLSQYGDLQLLVALAGVIVLLVGLLGLVLPAQAGAEGSLGVPAAWGATIGLVVATVVGLAFAARLRFTPQIKEMDSWVLDIDLACLSVSSQTTAEGPPAGGLEMLLRAGGMLPKWMEHLRKSDLDRNMRLWLAIFFLVPVGANMVLSGMFALGVDMAKGAVSLAAGFAIIGLLSLLYWRYTSKMRHTREQMMGSWNMKLGRLMEQMRDKSGGD